MANFFQDLLSQISSPQGGQQSAQLSQPIPQSSLQPTGGGSNFFQDLLSQIGGGLQQAGKTFGDALTAGLPQPGYGPPTDMHVVSAPHAPENPISRFLEASAYGKTGPELPLTGSLTTPLIQKVVPGYKSSTFKPTQLLAGLIGITPQSIADSKRMEKIQQTPTKDLTKDDLAFVRKFSEEQMQGLAIGSLSPEGIGGRGALEKPVSETISKIIPKVEEAAPKIKQTATKILEEIAAPKEGLQGKALSQEELNTLGNYLKKFGDDKLRGTVVKSYGGGQDVVFGTIKDRLFPGQKEYLVMNDSGAGKGMFRLHSTPISKSDIISTIKNTGEKVSSVTKNLLGEPLPWENEAAKVVKESATKVEEVAKKVPRQVVTEADDLASIMTKKLEEVRSKVNALDIFRTPDRVFKKMGLEEPFNILRASYNNYVKELPVEINRVTAWADRVKDVPDASRRIFQYLDGRATEALTPVEKQVATEIKAYLRNFADRLGLPPEARISDYITHIFPKGAIEKEFDPDLAKIISETVPKSIYDPFVQKRTGALGYKEDTWAALDAYIKRGLRKVNLDPALEEISSAAQSLPNESYQFVKHYIDNVNFRPALWETYIDNFLKSWTPIGYKMGARPFNALSQLARQQIYRGTLGLNPVSALKNLTQGVNTYAKLGEKYTLIGYLKAYTNRGLEDEFAEVMGKNMIEDRSLSAGKKFWSQVDPLLYKMFDTVEYINRASAYWGAKAKALESGATEEEARQAALKLVRDTQFTYGSIDTPMALQTDTGKLLFQFQSYTMKQTEFLAEMAKNKEYAGLLRYALASIGIISTIGKAIGMTPGDILPRVKVGASPVFQTAGDIAGLFLGSTDEYGHPLTLASRIKRLGRDIPPWIPGGVEANRIIKNLMTP